ncbi:MAG: low molecular weight protein arginine phosphatase [Firmicutes bacterium]|nr:low molecular weight protein arginine phosphatase [Bacillota bacterium]
MSEGGTVLFVCTGNTCRSPLAQGLWTALHPGARASSAGVGAWPGSPAAAAAQRVALEYGVDLSGHRSRHVRDVVEPVRRVFVMTREQAEEVVRMRPEWESRVELLTEAAGERGDIPDPLGAGLEVYRGLAERLLGLMRRIQE